MMIHRSSSSKPAKIPAAKRPRKKKEEKWKEEEDGRRCGLKRGALRTQSGWKKGSNGGKNFQLERPGVVGWIRGEEEGSSRVRLLASDEYGFRFKPNLGITLQLLQVIVCGSLLVLMAMGNFANTVQTLMAKSRFKAKMRKTKSKQDFEPNAPPLDS